MAVSPYYSENRLRCWPLQEPQIGQPGVAGTLSTLPKSAIVDAGFILGARSGFIPSLHTIYLHRVYKTGSVIYFDVRSTAPALANRYRWLFSFGQSDSLYSLSYGTVDRFSGADDLCGAGAIGDAYLVVGDLGALVGSLVGNQLTAPASPVLFEPATIQAATSQVLSISVANTDRTRTRGLPECDPDFGTPADQRAIFPVDTCLTGRVWLAGGRNVSLLQDPAGRLISIAASAGSGQQSCEEILTHPGEEPPEGSVLLTGGPRCQDVLSAINGLTGENIPIFSGLGVSVTPDDANSRIVIKSDMSGLLACGDGG